MVTIMIKYILFYCCLAIISCATPKAESKADLDKFIERKIQNTEIPNVEKLKEVALSEKYSYISYDQLWDSIIKIMIQNGLIVNSSKNKGLIIAFSDMQPAEPGQIRPKKYLAGTVYIYVERGDPIIVFLKADKPISKTFFDQLTTQVYSEKKWNYLFK